MASPRLGALPLQAVQAQFGAQFPAGLRVLLVTSNTEQLLEAEEQLKRCSYAVRSCSSLEEACLQLQSPGNAAKFDVVLMDAPNDSLPADILRSGIPLLLMGPEPDAAKLHAWIQAGAADFLEKPLSMARLQTIWTHTVRRMMSSPAPQQNAQQAVAAAAPPAGPGGAGPAAQVGAQRPQQRADSGVSVSMSAHAESGSNASTSEAVTHKASDPELDNTSSLVADDVLDIPLAALFRSAQLDASTNHMVRIDSQQLGALANGMSHLIMNESNPSSLNASLHGVNEAQAALSAAAMDTMPRPAPAPVNRRRSRELAGLTSGGSLERSRSSPLFAAGAANGRFSLDSAAAASRPAMGHPAGRLPPLAEGTGVAWGLPTTPLNIVPKMPPGCPPAGMPGMHGPSPLGMGMGMMGHHMPSFLPGVGLLPGMMHGMHGMHHMAGMPGMHHMPGMGMGMGMGMGPGMTHPGFMPPLSVAAAAPDLQLPAPPAPGMMPTPASGGQMGPSGLITNPNSGAAGSVAASTAAAAAHAAAVKRMQSAPLPCTSPPLPLVPGSFEDFGDMMVGDDGDPLAALDPQQLLASCGFAAHDAPDLTPVLTGTGPSHSAPIGLALRKTPSFMDMVAASLHDME